MDTTGFQFRSTSRLSKAADPFSSTAIELTTVGGLEMSDNRARRKQHWSGLYYDPAALFALGGYSRL